MRVLRNDLNEGWANPRPQRSLELGQFSDLFPLSELDHPIVRKAAEMFGADPDEDLASETIRCSGELRLAEVRAGQWRGGVWTDPDDGARWLCCAGLAKSEHRGHDDFYVLLEGQLARDPAVLLPTQQDRVLRRREAAEVALARWEEAIQGDCREMLAEIGQGLESTRTLPHPIGKAPLGWVHAARHHEPELGGIAIHVTVTLEPRYRASDLAWMAIQRVLVSFSPPHQQWDRTGDLFVTLEDPDHIARQCSRLDQAINSAELIHGEPGSVSHYIHRERAAAHTVQGTAARALCGSSQLRV